MKRFTLVVFLIFVIINSIFTSCASTEHNVAEDSINAEYIKYKESAIAEIEELLALDINEWTRLENFNKTIPSLNSYYSIMVGWKVDNWFGINHMVTGFTKKQLKQLDIWEEDLTQALSKYEPLIKERLIEIERARTQKKNAIPDKDKDSKYAKLCESNSYYIRFIDMPDHMKDDFINNLIGSKGITKGGWDQMIATYNRQVNVAIDNIYTGNIKDVKGDVKVAFTYGMALEALWLLGNKFRFASDYETKAMIQSLELKRKAFAIYLLELGVF
jgi:hypothetical protein